MQAKISATTTALQIPSAPKNTGNTSTAIISNTNVLPKEINAEVNPSFKAVKKAEAKMLKPEKRKDNAHMEKAWADTSRSSLL